MRYLTERQRDVLAFVERHLESAGVAPTLREIAEEFGFASTASAQKHIALLEKKGFLRREKHQKRGLSLSTLNPGSSPANPSAELPLLGTVAAGSPIESIAGEETIAVPRSLLGPGPHFALRVRGDSMIDDGIHDGDLVLLRAAEQAQDGDMVVALVADEVTLKRLYRERSGWIRLQPSNPSLAPLVVPSKDVTVQGRVVGLLRRY